MTRARLLLLAVCIVPAVIFGTLVGTAAAALGGIAGFAVGVVGVAVIGKLMPRFVARYVLPRQFRSGLRRIVGDGEAPPAGARPVDLPLAERYAAAVNGRDWAALAALVDPELVVVHPASSRPHGRRRFVRA